MNVSSGSYSQEEKFLFGRRRVAAPYTLADLVHPNGINPFDYEQTLNGGTITYETNEGSIHLQGSANGAAPLLRTWDDYRYQAGKAQVWEMTVIHDDVGVPNQARRWGYFDNEDGLYFELDGTDLGIVVRSNVSGSPIPNRIEREDWNIDKLDGSGPSGLSLGSNLHITDDLVWSCRFQWLSSGPAEWRIADRLVHISRAPIVSGAPFMRSATLPVSCQLVNSAAVSNTGFWYICASVTSDGGSDPPEHGFGYTTSQVSVGTTEIPLVSLRAGALYNGIRSRRTLIPVLAAFGSETNRAGIAVRWNPTLTGATWAVTPDSLSSAQVDVAATSFSGGTEIVRFLVSAGSGVNFPLSEFFSRFGRRLRARSSDIVTITAVNEQAGTTNIRGSIGWREAR